MVLKCTIQKNVFIGRFLKNLRLSCEITLCNCSELLSTSHLLILVAFASPMHKNESLRGKLSVCGSSPGSHLGRTGLWNTCKWGCVLHEMKEGRKAGQTEADFVYIFSSCYFPSWHSDMRRSVYLTFSICIQNLVSAAFGVTLREGGKKNKIKLVCLSHFGRVVCTLLSDFFTWLYTHCT